MKPLTKPNKNKLSERLRSFVAQGEDAVVAQVAACARPDEVPYILRDYALHRGLIEGDTDALWADLRQAARLEFALRPPLYYTPSATDYTRVWDVMAALASGDADVFAKWTAYVPAKLEGGHPFTVAMANLVTALAREDEALLYDARRRSADLLRGRSLGHYERALLEILDAGVVGDTTRLSAALAASVLAWPTYFKSNRWRDDYFLVLDAGALFNLVRTRVGQVAFPDHERWRTPPPLERGPGRALIDFSTRIPVLDRWWRSFPELADASAWRT